LHKLQATNKPIRRDAKVTSIVSRIPRVAMSILVRDEVDIIEANIRYHAAQGVEHFVVTDNGSIDGTREDNGSIDGTREVLSALRNEFSLDIIDEPAFTIDQDLWVTRMAKQLQAMNRFDWIIHNDADEFWVPQHGLLSDAIETSLQQASSQLATNALDIGVLSCRRLNMLPNRADLAADHYAFHDNVHAVLKPVALQAGEHAWSNEDTNCLARMVMDKVLTRTVGLGAIEYGNHGAEHNLKKVDCSAITVLHFPVRTYEQFIKKVVNYGESLKRNTRFSAGSSLHLRYWYDRYVDGRLEEDYAHMTFDNNRLVELIESGQVCVDQRVSDYFNTATLGFTEAAFRKAA